MDAVRRLATQHLSRMIIYAHTYNSDRAAKAEYERFHRWTARHRSEVSIWRVFTPQDAEWWVVVVDDSDGDTLQHFPWRGRRLALPLAAALGFIERRAEWLRAKHANGRRGAAYEKTSYGLAAAPRLRADGTWETPTPGRG
jgi:hypothetical protein